jgi:hypothetical protein
MKCIHESMHDKGIHEVHERECTIVKPILGGMGLDTSFHGLGTQNM